MSSHFSSNYFEARDKFLSVAQQRTDEVYSVQCGENLSTDAAVWRSMTSRHMLLITSGVHGIEGFAGSAIQLMIANNLLDKILPRASVCMIHAVNPWGFANFRRVNENNVDLNRAFFDEPAEHYPTDPNQAELCARVARELVPTRRQRSYPLESLAFEANVFKQRLRFGTRALEGALISGQYSDSEALFYGGTRSGQAEPEVLNYRSILERVTAGIETLVHFDLHTGLGNRYDVTPITEHEGDSDEWSFIRRVAGNVVTEKNALQLLGFEPHVRGSLLQYTSRHSRAARTASFLVDYGTAPKKQVLKAVAFEHQIYRNPDSDPKRAAAARNRLKEAFCPSTSQWRDSLFRSSTTFIERICETLETFRFTAPGTTKAIA